MAPKNMSKICYFLILIVFVVSFSSTLQSVFSTSGNWSNHATEKPSSGSGTSSNPYVITKGGQLYYWINSQSSTATTYAKLGCDIDLTSHYWKSVLKRDYSYHLDGNGFVINNLRINETINYNGLFGWVKNLTVKNLIVNCKIEVNPNALGVGAIAGCVSGALNIEKCAVKGTITVSSDSADVGGLVGLAYSNTTISNCFNSANISGGANLGGILGKANASAVISLCENEGQIKSNYEKSCSGGIVGRMVDSGAITKCFNIGKVSCSKKDSNAGGIVAYLTKSITISNCFNTADISGAENYASGICAYANAGCTIQNCYNTGTITAANGGVEYESITDETVDIIEEYSNYSDDVYYVEEYESGGDSSSSGGTSEPDFGPDTSGSESAGVKMKYKDIKILESLKNIGLCGYGNTTITNSMSTLNTPSSYNYLSGNASVVLADGTTYEYGDFSIDNNLKLTGGSYVGDLAMEGSGEPFGTGNVIYGKEGTYLGSNWFSGYPSSTSQSYSYKLKGFAFGLDYYEDEEYKSLMVSYGTYAEEEVTMTGAGIGANNSYKRNCVLMVFFYDVSLEEIDYSTKEEIKAANFGTAYTTDSNINNGYPFIKDFYWYFS